MSKDEFVEWLAELENRYRRDMLAAEVRGCDASYMSHELSIILIRRILDRAKEMKI